MKVCKKCGASDRYLNGNCKLCARDSQIKWRMENPEKVKAYNTEWREKNPEKVRAYRTEWCEKNPEKARAGKTEWREKNRDKIKQHSDAYCAANKDKLKAAGAAYYAANKEKCKAACAKYYFGNLEKCKKVRAVYREENKDLVNAMVAAWGKANPLALRSYSINRKRRVLVNGGKLSKGLTAKLLKIQKGMCACCKLPLEDNFHLDHIMPIFLGGANIDGNIQLLCPPCNMSKGKKHPVDFMQSRGFLL